MYEAYLSFFKGKSIDLLLGDMIELLEIPEAEKPLEKKSYQFEELPPFEPGFFCPGVPLFGL